METEHNNLRERAPLAIEAHVSGSATMSSDHYRTRARRPIDRLCAARLIIMGAGAASELNS